MSVSLGSSCGSPKRTTSCCGAFGFCSRGALLDATEVPLPRNTRSAPPRRRRAGRNVRRRSSGPLTRGRRFPRHATLSRATSFRRQCFGAAWFIPQIGVQCRPIPRFVDDYICSLISTPDWINVGRRSGSIFGAETQLRSATVPARTVDALGILRRPDKLTTLRIIGGCDEVSAHLRHTGWGVAFR